jgi:TATA-box binding protein (TBP) (component of TFIID and TFIIIB)
MFETCRLPVINNVKIHFKINRDQRLKLKEEIKKISEVKHIKRHQNFIVFKSSYAFIIFPKSGTVNISGIKSLSDISNAIHCFCATFDISRSSISSEAIVDNITATGSFGQEVNLKTLKETINSKEKNQSQISAAAFNPNYFPAVFCKTFGIGTVLVFGSGKYNIVGAKCQEHVLEIYRLISVLIKKL